MKSFSPFSSAGFSLLLAAGLLLGSLSGCGHRTRPASTLSEKDRTILAKYENIRAGLVEDDLRTTNRAAADLGTYLKPQPDSPATPLDASLQDLATANFLDKARTAFKTLSDGVVPLADGVEGYYIMDSPSPEGAQWVQRISKPDNPYMGRPMRDQGTLHR